MSEQESLQSAREIMVDSFGRVYAMYGMPETVGRIYGLLYFSDQALGLEDIAAGLGVSKATVSIHIRFLEGLKSVRKVWIKGNRRDYYEAERDLGKIMAEQLETSFIREQQITLEAIDRSRKVLSELQQSSNVDILQEATQLEYYLKCLQDNEEWGLQFIKDLLEGWSKHGR